MITLHYLDNSRAHRILWLLEELGLSYDVRIYHRGSDMLAPDSLKAVHPLGKSPVIVDNGRVLAESGAICDYLIDTYGPTSGLRPAPDTDAFLAYRYWLHYAEGSAMPLLLLKLIFAKLPSQVPWFLKLPAGLISKGFAAKLVDPQMKTHMTYWNDELSRTGWFAGEQFSAADIMMSFPVETAMVRAAPGTETAAIRAYLAAIRERPAYKRALEQGGRYIYATS
ncbi:glutathione S-transferase family protein [Rhizobium halophytocola]|uniref:Glutathione S-transferase n=1 Tax=Rhizobium halophytocola TaxID=735519 RepID=A0ABS4E3Y0_9HYPH|nr:glutathione S-transferase [Rhizobium halophytocola]MBP1852657.1 glutathione S-transferase [Rhizobium halophytocola]